MKCLASVTGQHDPDTAIDACSNADEEYSIIGTCKHCGVKLVVCKICDYCHEATSTYRRSNGSYFKRHLKNRHSDIIQPNKRQKGAYNPADSSEVGIDFGGSGFDDQHPVDGFDDDDDDSFSSLPSLKPRQKDDDDDDDSIISFEDQSNQDEHGDDKLEHQWQISEDTYVFECEHHAASDPISSAVGYLSFGYEDFAFLQGAGAGSLDNPYLVNNNQLFFWEQYRSKAKNAEDGTGGWRSLCHRALSRNKRDTTKLASEKTSKLLHQLNEVLLNTSKGAEGDALMDLVDSICTQMQEKVDECYGYNSKSVIPEGLPRSYAEARNILLTGSHSVMQNFPAPEVFTIGNHACVSLKETIQMLAGHHGGFEFTWDARRGENGIRNVNGLNGTKAAANLALNVRQALGSGAIGTSIGFVTFWSDSFLKSFIKQKDNSVWLFCVTISPPPDQISMGTYTQVLAIGKSGQDHTDVVNHYYRELEELEKGFKCYFADDNNIREVAFSLLYHSADRPERQSVLNTLGEGTYGKVTNFSVEISEEMLPACLDCYKDQIRRSNNDNGDGNDCIKTRCSKCFCWDIDPDDPAQEIMPVPDGYPGHAIARDFDGNVIHPPLGREPGRKHIGPIRLSSEWLIKACKCAYELRRSGRWTKKEFDTYLRTCCVSQSRRDIINGIAMKDRSNKSHTESNRYVPSVWLRNDCFDMCMFPDMPMHAVAHGIGGDVIQFYHDVLSKFKMATNFGNFTNDVILDVSRFNLDWCKLKTYPKSAWVGEHIMAYLRLGSYFYGMYLLNHPLQQDHQPLQDCMKRMMNAFQAMLSILMSNEPPESRVITDRLKLFMSASHFCDLEFAAENDVANNPQRKAMVVDLLSIDEVMTVLHALHITDSQGKDPRSVLNSVTVNSLKRKLKARDLPTTGKNKAEHQILLFNSLLDRQLSMTSQHQVNNENNVSSAELPPIIEDENNANVFSSGSLKKTYVWDKGAWLSFVTNIAHQIEILGPLRLIWEARDENSIRTPKASLHAMRKTKEYFSTKLRMIHRRAGLSFLKEAYRNHPKASRNWYRGYHRFQDKHDVMNRFETGKPLSCFIIGDDFSRVHVAYSSASSNIAPIDYATFDYTTSEMHTKETGVHFCKFRCVEEQTSASLGDMNITHFALMLPYIQPRRDRIFQRQFTLIYSDWEVLRCDLPNTKKGPASTNNKLFQSILSEIN